ncbi:maleylpyruvate isomerase family mycothiol-dependent enzyme [Streptomyces genisteinicus]|uniref:Maleylpyruvate isomerase family mycothiol-dependent enzyme n=1 Tax=Streptomyces genisteinicus TaxID=2768068 RepID=A0A7H0I4T5_9ACTN|nr:maleylpyruvate isomerase family mycothiol-dependent enzyme [Streptomyces genisteinicus]QNP67801.1 maleylpyruvate isomerase family mycothiol-dependent enzyme [Streptomyces genisteinicus]
MESAAVDVRAEIAAERRELAGVLDGLTGDQWNAPSLCGGWRVREVAAHMSMGFRYSFTGIAVELARSGGNLHRMTDRVARRDAAVLTPHDLAAALRDNARHPWGPPVGGPAAALGHDVVHGLDITVALGLGRQVPEGRLRIVLTTVKPSTLRFFRAGIGDVELRATDLEWSYGRGTPVARPAQELLLLAYGRTLPAARADD